MKHFQIAHQAISCITCKYIKISIQRMDEKIESFFYEKGISFNVADSSSFNE